MKNSIFAILALFFMGITLHAQGQSEVLTNNVVVVWDGSGSMAENFGGAVKMDAAKLALKATLTKLPKETKVGVVCFNNSRDPWIYPIGNVDSNRLIKAINPVKPSGATPLGAFMKVGADVLLRERTKQFGYGTYRLLVVTDGEATDSDIMEKYAPEIVSRGIVMDVIGVGMKNDHSLKRYANSYQAANDAKKLSEAVKNVLGEVSRNSGNEQAEDFGIIQGIPDKMAKGIIDSFSKASKMNYPIGEKPPVQESRVEKEGEAIASPSPSSEGSVFPIVIAFAVIFAIGFFKSTSNNSY
jgi:hypothetical protein